MRHATLERLGYIIKDEKEHIITHVNMRDGEWKTNELTDHMGGFSADDLEAIATMLRKLNEEYAP